MHQPASHQDGAEPSPLELLSIEFEPGNIGKVAQATIERIKAEMNSNAQRLGYLTQYLVGLYYEDQQRLQAERQMRWLVNRQRELVEELNNCVQMLYTLHEPVAVNT